MFIRHFQIKFILLLLSFSVAGCYGDINISCEVQAPGCFDHDSLNLYFFHSAVVRRPAKGISAFPDGGIPKILFKKVTFSRYNMVQKSLETILDYGSMPWSSSRWKYNIYVRNDTVAFMIEPVSGWEKELKWGLDSAYYQKFRYLYVYQLRNGDISRYEPSGNEIFTTLKVPVSEMKKLTGNLKYSDWGIIIDEISHAGKNQMIRDLSGLRGNQEYRNALIEILGDELTKKEIAEIKSEINKYLNSLSDYERLLKKESAEITIDRLSTIK
ncbi:MAG TPA: hypothetical protein VMV47_01810 [Bacteroidales bacterium]|nr:hypothetical protein [Bacteroidales bacterium]